MSRASDKRERDDDIQPMGAEMFGRDPPGLRRGAPAPLRAFLARLQASGRLQEGIPPAAVYERLYLAYRDASRAHHAAMIRPAYLGGGQPTLLTGKPVPGYRDYAAQLEVARKAIADLQAISRDCRLSDLATYAADAMGKDTSVPAVLDETDFLDRTEAGLDRIAGTLEEIAPAFETRGRPATFTRRFADELVPLWEEITGGRPTVTKTTATSRGEAAGDFPEFLRLAAQIMTRDTPSRSLAASVTVAVAAPKMAGNRKATKIVVR